MMRYLLALDKYVVTMGANEKDAIDSGIPRVDDKDRNLIVSKIMTFYQEYYNDSEEL